MFSPSWAAASLLAHDRSRPSAPANPPARASPPHAPAYSRHPALRSPRPSPAPFPCSPLAHAPTAAENSRRVAAMCRHRPPRGSRGLTLLPRARFHLPKRCTPLHSIPPALSHSRARFSSRAQRARHRAPPHPPGKFAAPPPPRPAIERQQLRLALRHLVLMVVMLLSQGRAILQASPPSAMAPLCSAAVEGILPPLLHPS